MWFVFYTLRAERNCSLSPRVGRATSQQPVSDLARLWENSHEVAKTRRGPRTGPVTGVTAQGQESAMISGLSELLGEIYNVDTVPRV